MIKTIQILNSKMKTPVLKIALVAVIFSWLPTHAQQLSPADQEYFESKIRPVLVDYCYGCHGDGATKGSLDLGSKAGALAGGSTGPAVVPGDPGKSVMIRRLKDLGDPMPPAGKDALPDELIAELENWIRRGAPDPRTGKSAGVIKTQQDMEKAKNHWGFKPVETPTLPSPDLIYNGKLKGWIKNPVDAYVLRKLEEHEMVPSLPAQNKVLGDLCFGIVFVFSDAANRALNTIVARITIKKSRIILYLYISICSH